MERRSRKQIYVVLPTARKPPASEIQLIGERHEDSNGFRGRHGVGGAASAEEKESIIEKIGDLGKAVPTSAKPGGTHSAAAYGSGVRVVVAKDSIIQPGAFKDDGEVPADFSGAENVSISISAPNSNLIGTTIAVFWASPDEYFAATDFIKGSSLVDKTTGGGRVPVYGSALRIVVANDGTAPVTIKQLAVYAFVH